MYVYVYVKEYASDQSRILVTGRLVQCLANNSDRMSRTGDRKSRISVQTCRNSVFLNIGVFSQITVTARNSAWRPVTVVHLS